MQHSFYPEKQACLRCITFETDYPHTDSTWPHSRQVAEDMMGHLPADVVWKIVRGNAARMLDLDIEPAPAPHGPG